MLVGTQMVKDTKCIPPKNKKSVPIIFTYIIKTKSDEYYCGKTNNVSRRIIEHKKEKYPHWFSSKSRKEFKVIFTIKGDYEMNIKRFGVKNFCDVLYNINDTINGVSRPC